MKKIISTSPVVLFILYSLIPALYLFGLLGGYSLKLRFGEELLAAFAIYSLVILMNLGEYPLEKDKTNIFLSTQLLPLSFFSGLIAISHCKSLGCIIFSAVCIYCSIQLFRHCAKNGAAWSIYKFVAIAMALVFGIFSLTKLSTAQYDDYTMTHQSPNGTYTVRITTVEQYSNVEILKTEHHVELYVFYYEDIPQTINIDHPADQEDVSVSFADENTLVINEIQYHIK